MQKLKIFNTMGRKLEDFEPTNADFVWMYSCGPTVYRSPTIGNRRATWTADLIRNTLQAAGYKVRAVMNFTDVGHLTDDGDHGEDKLEKWSKREWLTTWDIAKKYENEFRDWMKKLKIWDFDVMPRATEHIAEQIEIIKTLENKNLTYVIAGDGIYMDTIQIPDYGKLMWPDYKKHIEWLRSGIRISDRGKKNPTDFALWKFSPVDGKRQMERDSPRWMWFPGRHIECSAMSIKYLGDNFDIHHGGYDHISVHHSNEIAQSECFIWDDKKPRVKYRIHNQFLQVDGGRMGKSLGNWYTISDIENRWFDATDLRMFYFQSHYRNPQNFTRENLQNAHNSIKSLKNKISSFDLDAKDITILEQKILQKTKSDRLHYFDQWFESLLEDFNTPAMIWALHASVATCEKKVEIWKKSKQELLEDRNLQSVYFFEKNILKLGLFEAVQIPEEIINLADQRQVAKLQKNRKLADELREKIQNMGFCVKDKIDGYDLETK